VIVNSGAQTIEFADGSAGAPSITNSGDTNTGMFFPAADTIAFAEGGTEAMRIDSSGNVGIGTTSPGFKLQVSSTGGTGISATDTTSGSSSFAVCRADTPTSSGFLLQGNANFGVYGGANSLNIINTVAGPIAFINSSGTERMQINSGGSLILAGSTAQKASGTTWSNPSDQRLKDNIRDYTKGTTELMQVRVREWEYNGKGGTTEGLKGLGVVADEVMTVLPNTVETYDAKLNADDTETTAIKKFDATEITWLLVKTVQELKAELDNVKTELATLKGTTL
jgi:hypothetical protein